MAGPPTHEGFSSTSFARMMNANPPICPIRSFRTADVHRMMVLAGVQRVVTARPVESGVIAFRFGSGYLGPDGRGGSRH
jgi:hypothetical protein